VRPGLAYVVNALNPGGTERLVIEMSLAFAQEYRVSVFCLDEPGLWAPELRERGIAVECLWRQPGLDLTMPGKLAQAFRAHGTEIIHAHQCTPWFYAALSRLRHSHPRLLLEEHGRFYPEADRRARRIVNRLLIAPLTQRFVAVSADIRARLVRYEGLDAARIEVIYNGVRAEAPLGAAARQALRSELGLAPERFVVGTVGRFDAIKNLPLLARSIAAAREVAPQVCGLLVGDGPELERIRALAQELGLAEHIVLPGYRADARRLLQCLDLFALASWSEGTSLALLESMAARVPVAVTAVGGNPEIVEAGRTGWVVPSGDGAALTAAILAAVRDTPMRERLAAAGRRRYEEQFTLARMIEAYRGLYRALLPTPAAAEQRT